MDTAERPHIGTHCSPLIEAAVLSSFQEILASTIVGKLVEDPSAILHLGRVNLPVVPAVGQVVLIFSAVQHLTAEVRTLINTDPECTRGL